MLFRGLIQHVHSSAVYLVTCNDGLTLLTAGFTACGGAHMLSRTGSGRWPPLPGGRDSEHS